MGQPFFEREGLNLLTYDLRTPGAFLGDIPFYVEEAERSGGPVLELGVGTGRVALALAAAGHEVAGIDLSAAMLRRAEAKLAALPDALRVRARFHVGDMRAFALGRRFPLAIVPFRAFQHLLEPADQRRALDCIRAHLEPAGHLIIDLFDPRLDYCLPGAGTHVPERELRDPATGNAVRIRVVERRNDAVRQVFTETWEFTERAPDGAVLRDEREDLALRWTYRQEARWLFELSGFAVEAEYSDFRRAPPAYGAEQVWMLRRAR